MGSLPGVASDESKEAVVIVTMIVWRRCEASVVDKNVARGIDRRMWSNATTGVELRAQTTKRIIPLKA